jgi:hypothetical protein
MWFGLTKIRNENNYTFNVEIINRCTRRDHKIVKKKTNMRIAFVLVRIYITIWSVVIYVV